MNPSLVFKFYRCYLLLNDSFFTLISEPCGVGRNICTSIQCRLFSYSGTLGLLVSAIRKQKPT